MVKKFFLMVILLAGTAFTVLFGEAFNFSFLTNTPTVTAIVTTQSLQPTATLQLTATELPSATQTSAATPEATSTPEFTATSEESVTPLSTATPMLTNTPAPTFTPTSTEETYNELFQVQTGSPVFISNFVHPEAGCNWQGVAGQVFTSSGLPLVGYVVRITGTYNNASVNMIGLTGLVENVPYGPGSFEFVLGSQAFDSEKLLEIQLFDPSGLEVTSPLEFSTFSSCSKNLQIINFVAK